MAHKASGHLLAEPVPQAVLPMGQNACSGSVVKGAGMPCRARAWQTMGGCPLGVPPHLTPAPGMARAASASRACPWSTTRAAAASAPAQICPACRPALPAASISGSMHPQRGPPALSQTPCTPQPWRPGRACALLIGWPKHRQKPLARPAPAQLPRAGQQAHRAPGGTRLRRALREGVGLTFAGLHAGSLGHAAISSAAYTAAAVRNGAVSGV